jgi:DNA-binding CsgD family transcriptional regulator
LPPGDARIRVAIAHLSTLAIALVVLAVEDRANVSTDGIFAVLVVVVGISVLRTLAVKRRLVVSTLVLDATGTALLLVGTGAPGSAFYVFALAGAFWAACVPRWNSGLTYGLAFALVYAVVVGPLALAGNQLAAAVQDVIALLVVAVLSDWFVRVDPRAMKLTAILDAPPFAADHVEIRGGLERALGVMDMPLEVAIAAGRIGLTAIQAQLLSYLVVGLTNYEIADATGVSESAVRYRLTRLYRALGVRGRKQAARRALELGLAQSVHVRSASA